MDTKRLDILLREKPEDRVYAILAWDDRGISMGIWLDQETSLHVLAKFVELGATWIGAAAMGTRGTWIWSRPPVLKEEVAA